jgi:hypothetical protein
MDEYAFEVNERGKINHYPVSLSKFPDVERAVKIAPFKKWDPVNNEIINSF